MHTRTWRLVGLGFVVQFGQAGPGTDVDEKLFPTLAKRKSTGLCRRRGRRVPWFACTSMWMAGGRRVVVVVVVVVVEKTGTEKTGTRKKK